MGYEPLQQWGRDDGGGGTEPFYKLDDGTEYRGTLYGLVTVNGADHTSGTMRVEYRTEGGHVHCRVFGPFSGKAGDLVFRVEEWEHFRRTNPGWQFTADSPRVGA